VQKNAARHRSGRKPIDRLKTITEKTHGTEYSNGLNLPAGYTFENLTSQRKMQGVVEVVRRDLELALPGSKEKLCYSASRKQIHNAVLSGVKYV
jgi:hypothetical protein